MLLQSVCLLCLCLYSPVTPAPQGLVIISTTSSTTSTTATDVSSTDQREATQPTEVTRFHVTSTIQFRYSRTVVESHVINPDSVAQQADFSLVIPDSAFISNFSMEISGEEYVARVEEKEKAEETFQKAVNRGRGAGLVTQNVRDANRFTVAANLEGEQKIIFRLTYDELLDRKTGLYEQAINIDLKEVVDDFKVVIFINESLPITTINVPELLQSNEINFEEEAENTIAVVKKNTDGDSKKAKIVFAPSLVEQKAAEEQRVSGQLVIKYDVDRQGQDSEVQVIDGYFVHYFVPENLETLPKHAIFILDISGSMSGEKIIQLKDAMFTVLDDMKPTDFFNILTFSSDVTHWMPESLKTPHSTPLQQFIDIVERVGGLMLNEEEQQTIAVPATDDNRKAAIHYVLGLNADGGTNINDAMLAGVKVARDTRRTEQLPKGVASMIIFLSDGEATEGETSADKIKSNIDETKAEIELPIFTIAFGRNADYALLKEISQGADSFCKRVYEDSDAALQLENFYSEISSPVVTNLQFEYVGDLVDNSSISNTELKTFFKGGQFIVAGKLMEVENGSLSVHVTGDKSGERYDEVIDICLSQPIVPVPHSDTEEDDAELSVLPSPPIPVFGCHPVNPIPPRSEAQEFMQSLHAFLNIKQLLNKDEKEDALRLALKNNFVTSITSLVVVRPGEDDSLADLEEAENTASYNAYGYAPQSAYAYGAPAPAYGSPASSYGAPAPAYGRPAPAYANKYFTSAYGSVSTTPTYQAMIQYDLSYPYDYADDTYDTAYSTYYTSTTTVRTSTTSTTTTTTQSSTCSGNLTLYSTTYYRKEMITLEEDSSNLDTYSDQAVSAKLEGTCCWILHSDINFSGSNIILSHNQEYKNAISFGALLRDVSSVQKMVCQ